jgi:hypothetical protein
MDDRVAALDDARAVAGLNVVVDLWTKSDGLGALRDIEQLRLDAHEQNVAIPDSLMVSDLSKVTPEQGEIAREILSGLLESDDARVRNWASTAVGRYSGEHAQVDPLITPIVITGLFAAMVLVSKVYTDEKGRLRLQKLHKGDVAAIAGIAATMFGLMPS